MDKAEIEEYVGIAARYARICEKQYNGEGLAVRKSSRRVRKLRRYTFRYLYIDVAAVRDSLVTQ